MKPIAADEFTSWSEAAATVKRFHEFFSECKEAIGSALAAKPISNSARHAYAYQDYLWDDGDRIVVGIDAGEWGPRHAVTLWMAVEAKHRDDWNQVRERLDATPPEGWTTGKPWWWGERPIVWRYLDEVIGAGTFDEQREQLAKACSVGAYWLRAAENGRTADTLQEPSIPT
jgi:hypothetical protein